MSITDKTIEQLQAAVVPEKIELNGVEYSSRKLFDMREAEPVIQPLGISTLQGLIDIWGNGLVEVERVAAIYVTDHQTVTLVGRPFGRFRQREVFASANVYRESFRFGVFMLCDQFIVEAQSRIVRTADLEKLLAVVGNLSHQTEINANDDGVTQTVTVQTGVVRKGVKDLPNPVVLAPYRTFTEVEQPESTFIVRIEGDERAGPRVALFEADGGAWKREATVRIKKWFEDVDDNNGLELPPIIG